MNEIWKLKRDKRRKKQKLKDIITAVALLVCLTGLTVYFLLSYLGIKQATTYDHGSESLVTAHPEKIPDYFGEPYVVLNKDKPQFNGWDLKNVYGERYSEIDSKGRCGPAFVRLHKSLMPEEERGSLGRIKPSGWDQEKYAGIVDATPPYLYNRCHLVAYAMTGQDANYKNLITGTTYMNTGAMLSFEEQILHCLDDTDYHILYRVTPYFKGRELVARGVEMEAYSVEDKGDSVCFHVFVYNVQPGVEINYLTGQSRLAETEKTQESGETQETEDTQKTEETQKSEKKQ
ncbi:MAG: DNA/RNA non-specific endonuclease [Lachnospiraceae bacterium]|nr:DNA/RNA non-specific endonuclease [Lachnospiraceae bacterium]